MSHSHDVLLTCINIVEAMAVIILHFHLIFRQKIQSYFLYFDAKDT